MEINRTKGRRVCYAMSPVLKLDAPLSCYTLVDLPVLNASGVFNAVKLFLPDGADGFAPDESSTMDAELPMANLKIVLAMRQAHADVYGKPLLVRDCDPVPVVLRNGTWTEYPKLLEEHCLPLYWPKLLVDFYGLKPTPNGYVDADEERELAKYAKDCKAVDDSARAFVQWAVADE